MLTWSATVNCETNWKTNRSFPLSNQTLLVGASKLLHILVNGINTVTNIICKNKLFYIIVHWWYIKNGYVGTEHCNFPNKIVLTNGLKNTSWEVVMDIMDICFMVPWPTHWSLRENKWVCKISF